MEKKKIAFVIHGLGGGGAERVTSILCNCFVEKMYDVHLICNVRSENEYHIKDEVKMHVIGQDTYKSRILAAAQRFFRLRNLFKKEKFDAIVGMMKMGEISVLANIGLGYPIIISVRNDPSQLYPSALKRFYARTVLSLATGAVFQTEMIKKWFPRRLQEKAMVILNPIGRQFYEVERHSQPGLLVATGRLHKQKNYCMMIKAVSEVAKHHKIRLEIYGKGKEETELKEYAKTIGTEGFVEFCGQSSDMPSILSVADIFLLSSDYEGLPNGLMEAMAVGVPCVSTDCGGGGARQLLGDSERGLLTPVGDDGAFAKAISSLLENPSLKSELEIAAKEYSRRFLEDNCSQMWEDYIKKYL